MFYLVTLLYWVLLNGPWAVDRERIVTSLRTLIYWLPFSKCHLRRVFSQWRSVPWLGSFLVQSMCSMFISLQYGIDISLWGCITWPRLGLSRRLLLSFVTNTFDFFVPFLRALFLLSWFSIYLFMYSSRIPELGRVVLHASLPTLSVAQHIDEFRKRLAARGFAATHHSRDLLIICYAREEMNMTQSVVLARSTGGTEAVRMRWNNATYS